MKKFYCFLISLCVLTLIGCDNYHLSEPGEHHDSDSIISADTLHPDEPDLPDLPDPRTPDQRRDLGYLFDLNAIPVITITVTEEQWNQYLRNFDEDMNNRKYISATFTFEKNGDKYVRENVGLRPRGNTSRRRPEGYIGEMHNRNSPNWHHAHFGIKFTEAEDGERFFGMDRIVLKWHKDDPAYCREVFCYDLFHRFGVWSAPHASYCRLNLYVEGDSKPAYFGVYEMIEGVRKGWMADRTKDGYIPDNDGNLWKSAWGANLSSADPSQMGVADDIHSYTYNLKSNKTEGLSAAQQELCDFINGMTPLPSGTAALKAWLEEHVDIDLFLRAYAVNVMVGMWDDYWKNQNNYYFYFDSNHRFYFIPYDYDNTLGTGVDSYGNPATDDMLNWGSLGGDRMLMRKVMSIAEYKNRYKAYIKELAQDANYMKPDAAIARVKQFEQFVQPYIINDTYEDMELNDSPASWSNFGYKLTSGGNGTNFFYTKVNSINW